MSDGSEAYVDRNAGSVADRLYSREGDSTPLLEHLLEFTPRGSSGLEVAMGAGSHFREFVAAGVDMVGVEYDEDVVHEAKELTDVFYAGHEENGFGSYDIIESCMFDYLLDKDESFDVVHGNSILHTLPYDRLKEFAELAYAATAPGGRNGYSFKTVEDEYSEFGEPANEEHPAGPVIVGPDGISRVFVEDPDPIIEVFEDAGFVYEELDDHYWSKEGFDEHPHDSKEVLTAHFWGGVFRKPA
mgnify:CR=1 FL=1|jgi:hypothetical protein